MRRASPWTVILASAIAAASSPVHTAWGAARGAAWAPRVAAEDRSQAFVTDGDAAFERGDYEEAIAKYRAAYYGLDPAQRTSYLGSLPVRNAMRAYTLLIAERQDRVVLERQLAFLAEFLESVAAQDGGAEQVGAEVMAELEAVRADVQLKLARLSQVVAPPPGAVTAPTPNPADAPSQGAPPTTEAAAEPEPGASPVAIDSLAPPPGRDPLGLGLAIGGGVTAGIGAGVMVGWWTVRRQAEAEADRVFGPDPSPARDEYLREEWYHARRYLIAGSTIVGLGLATAATGAVLLVVRRSRGSRAGMALRLLPAVGPQGAALRLSGRF